MIRPDDRVSLPPGVRLTPRGLEDDVRGGVYPLNGTARRVLELADGRTIREIAAVVAHGHAAAPERVLPDVIRFVAAQNARVLVAVQPHGSLLPRAAAEAARGLVPAWPRRRYDVAGAWRPLVAAAVAVSLPLTLVTLAVARRPLDALALGAAVGAGIVIHEAGHAVLLHGQPACVTVAGVRVAILHRPLPRARRQVVAAAGPAAAVAAGAAALAAAWSLGAGEPALAGSVLAAHGLALTVGAEDGRAVCGLS